MPLAAAAVVMAIKSGCGDPDNGDPGCCFSLAVHRLSCAALLRLASRSLSCVVKAASGGAGVGGGDGGG